MHSASRTSSGIRELKTKGKERIEKRRFVVVAVPRRSAAVCHLRLFSMFTAIMSSSYPRNNFMETDVMFLEFEDNLDNIAGGSSSVWATMRVRSSSQLPATPTLRRHAQSQLLELERHITINGCIPMMISPGAEKPVSPHTIRFSQAIGVCVLKIFLRFFVLDFNDQATNRFVEHQMLTTFKEFQVDCHRHFKKYSDLEKARVNLLNALVERHED
ncbi:CACTA en-spm transposon protein [Cucumis melo var. makuwa]|uniref:CACTA en-spm transposon protein n=1 Tax=Cucumis melo var. makuwa TaxID=1194695 RepID=A0A5A7U4T0_CUCMM|nr:CACTA en-spm transposon protein [Cucumis melo var. makuwa]TYK27169.1 CACTA en-spm transposon protein [Cucumis melo var. makuwa]